MTKSHPLQPAATNAAIYAGRILHHRVGAQSHRFTLDVFSLLLDLDELPALDAGSRLFRYNRPGLLAFHDRDHGPRDGSPLGPWVRTRLSAAGLERFGRKISILCFPRLFGHVFNPLSVYFCRDGDGVLGAVLYEVKNTFGGQHVYAVAIPEDAPAADVHHHQRQKCFHVSPFLGAQGRYRFRLRPPGQRYALSICLDDDEGNRLVAVQTARREPWGDRRLLTHLARLPLQPLRVIGGIHWHAWKLWRMGARFHRDPTPSTHPRRAGITGFNWQ